MPDEPYVDTVVKLGGGVLMHAASFAAALAAIAAAARGQRLLVVPGGGPFADTVRDVDRRMALSDAAAHWMAVLAMEQYAHLIAMQMAGAILAENPGEIVAAFRADHVPVLAPYRWLRTADPLPHSWNVTSDSIAAWVSGVVGARCLVLVKPPGLHLDYTAPTRKDEAAADGRPSDGVLDAYFDRALPHHVASVIVRADELDRLRAAVHHGT
jgi:5-(aminomethyl)-3-furanmethanol phosphate kinase